MNNILVYCMHRSASNFLHKLTSNICNEINIDHYSINNDNYYSQILSNGWRYFIQDKIGCFGPIRLGEADPSIPHDFLLDKIILQVRDPRDIITSLYYALCYRFPLNEDTYPTIEQQTQWKRDGVDKFVLDEAVIISKKINHMLCLFIKHDNVKIIKYEDMVENYSDWLNHYLGHFLSPDDRNYSRVYELLFYRYKNDFSVESEILCEHKRQVKPGDHIRKLQAKTIKKLNEIFGVFLKELKYEC